MDVRCRPGILFYGMILLVLAADQSTKAWVLASLRPVGTVAVIPGLFNLTFIRNTGIAFGMFAGQSWVVAAFMIGLAVLAFYYSRDLNWRSWEPNVVGGGLVGGALGNLIDRWRLGYVVDFLDLHGGHYHWYVFNVADSLICISVGWILMRSFGKK